MTFKHWLVIGGTLLSILLLAVIFVRLDWETFLTSFYTLRLPELIFAIIIIAFNVTLRSLRWNLITGIPLTWFKQFWQAVNIGYLGNLIYPARAGEALRIIAIHHLAPLTLGRATTSSIIDRLLDLFITGTAMLGVLWLHGNRFDASIGKGVLLILIATVIIFTLLIIYAERWYRQLQQWTVEGKWSKRLRKLLLHGLEGVQTFCHARHLIMLLTLTALTVAIDFYWMWQVTEAFGWTLPFEAAITIGVFLLLGAALPSAPGYIGIYQVACVLALGLYGIDESNAVAYSIVIQLIIFLVIGFQGTLVVLTCGFIPKRVNSRP